MGLVNSIKRQMKNTRNIADLLDLYEGGRITNRDPDFLIDPNLNTISSPVGITD